MPEPTMPVRRPVSVSSPGNDGFRYEPVPERTPPDDTEDAGQ
jgi:hypothetical protein